VEIFSPISVFMGFGDFLVEQCAFAVVSPGHDELA